MTDAEFQKWHSRKTLRSFFYSILGVILPFLLSLIGIMIISKYEYIISFLDDGQVLLFSVGLLTSAFYIFREDENVKEVRQLKLKLFKWKIRLENLGDFVMIFLLFSSVIYAILYIFQIITPSVNINISFIRIVSILIFLFSLFAIFQGIRVDNLNKYPKVDVRKESQKGVNNILDKLP